MKTQDHKNNIIEFRVVSTFNNGDSNLIETFETEKEANDFFNLILKNDVEYTERCHDLEIEKITNDDDIETLRTQNMFIEGEIDRYNLKGDSELIYGYEALWVAEKKQLEYTFYFQGKKQNKKFLESQLEQWYYKS